MPRDKTIKVYGFEELSATAKERAREWYRDARSGDDFWSDSVIEEMARQGALMGITFKERERKSMSGKSLPGEPHIWWSGFYSQGDGACFEGTWSARHVQPGMVAADWGDDENTREIKRIAGVFERIAKEFPDASFSVIHRGHYYHEHSTEFDVSNGREDVEPTDEQIWAMRFPDDPMDESGRQMAVDRWKDEMSEDELVKNARDFMRYIYRALEREWDYVNSDEVVDELIVANDYEFDEDGARL